MDNASILLVVSWACATLALLGAGALWTGMPWGRGSLLAIGYQGSSLRLVAGMVACVASAVLFGRFLASGWLGPVSVTAGFLTAVLTFLLFGGFIITVLPDNLALSITSAISGSVVAAIALIVSRINSKYGLVAIGLGSLMSVGWAYVLASIRDQTWLVPFVWGWVNVVFGWLVYIRRVGWWDTVVWITLLLASVAVAAWFGI